MSRLELPSCTICNTFIRSDFTSGILFKLLDIAESGLKVILQSTGDVRCLGKITGNGLFLSFKMPQHSVTPVIA